MITLSNINKKFGNSNIFSNYNLNIEEGEFVAITGQSGSGKTTLLNIMGFLEPCNSGSITIDGIKKLKVNDRKTLKLYQTTIGFLFQNFALIENRTVKQNLELAILTTDKSSSNRKINSVLKRVGLTGRRNDYIFQLSGGEQQRVAIARLLLRDYKIILADEPTGSLDQVNRDLVFKLLSELHNEGKTIVIVTHDLELAKRCDRTIKIERG